MSDKVSHFRVDSIGKFENLCGHALAGFVEQQDPGRGPKPKLDAWELVTSLVYHVVNGTGILSQHVYQLLGVVIKDGFLSGRRPRIGFEPFRWLMNNALRPLADDALDEGSFYKGLRLCGIDGSCLVTILPPGAKEAITVREIRGRVKKPASSKWSEVRIWTTLLDERTHPAIQLPKLHGFRWEQEIFYKELNISLRGGDVLHNHTPETAAQEVAALLMACSLMAEQRLAVAREGRLDPLNISFP
jgi:hypothetical protein